MRDPAQTREQFERDGFVILPGLFGDAECDALNAELTPLFEAQQHRAKSRIGGVRNLLAFSPCVAAIATAPKAISLLAALGAPGAFPVRSIFFDKTPDANWVVAWHQDVQIAVAERLEVPGFGPWTTKAGVTHVQPPAAILEEMFTVRLHLDDCDETNGALRVVPGSHAQGVLSSKALEESKHKLAVTCSVPKGGILVMRPLLLHASSSAQVPGHRRVLHLEYATLPLPGGLRWHERP